MAFTLVVASGKGGTGKTTVAVNLAWVLARRRLRVHLLDCDVEAPNCGLFLRPEYEAVEEVTILKPEWDASRCTGCGVCVEACRDNALALVKGRVLLFNELCHGCGVCRYVCPEGALRDRPARIGEIRSAHISDDFLFVEGRLDIGESLAPAVVRAVKQRGKDGDGVINIIDASPGAACPVVEALRGADMVWLVTEPTPFGVSGLRVATELVAQLGIPAAIIVNRSDGRDELVEAFSRETGVPIAVKIPFRREYAEAYSRGNLLAQTMSQFRRLLEDAFEDCLACVPRIPDGGEVPEPGKDEESEGRAGWAISGQRATEVAVISGKGGTGKTTVAASLAVLAAERGLVVADTDVDAADLHLVLSPQVERVGAFEGAAKAEIHCGRCDGCGKCAEVCRFEAISPPDAGDRCYRVDKVGCEGCGLCARVCPRAAITMKPVVAGRWYISNTRWGAMAHARLNAGEENSGRLVSLVRSQAGDLARGRGSQLVLEDGPPGIGCPVISAVTGVDMAVVVTEPTVSGAADMERVLKLCRHFEVPAVVIINKADLNPEQAARIKKIAEELGAQVVGSIPFDRQVEEAIRAGEPLVEHNSGPASSAVRDLWRVLEEVARPTRGKEGGS